MKKKLNLLCAMIFAVLLLSLSENIYSMVWGAIEGGKAGMENKAGEINNLHPLMLLPDNLSSTSDSIYNEMTGKNVPIWQIQSMVTVDTDAPGWLALINTLLGALPISSFSASKLSCNSSSSFAISTARTSSAGQM